MQGTGGYAADMEADNHEHYIKSAGLRGLQPVPAATCCSRSVIYREWSNQHIAVAITYVRTCSVCSNA